MNMKLGHVNFRPSSYCKGNIFK